MPSDMLPFPPPPALQDDPTSVITGRTLRELTELKEDVAAFIVSCCIPIAQFLMCTHVCLPTELKEGVAAFIVSCCTPF